MGPLQEGFLSDHKVDIVLKPIQVGDQLVGASIRLYVKWE